MRYYYFIILVLLFGCSTSAPRYYITYDLDEIEVVHPHIGKFKIMKAELIVKGDSILLHPEVMVFGNDPNIRIVRYDRIKHGILMGPRTTVNFLIFEPDTFAFSVYQDETILEDRIFIGLFKRGKYLMFYSLDEWHPAGKYLFELSVGEETKKITKIYLK